MTLPLLARAAQRPELRPYQGEAVSAIFERWRAGDRATLLVLATGLGKTIVFSEIVRRGAEQGRRCLILAHRTELLEQAADKLRTLGVDVALEQADKRAGREAAVVASVQTLQGKRLEGWKPDHFALVVIDEAHHAAARSYRRIVDHFGGARVLGVTATPDRGDGKALGPLFDSVAYRYEIGDGIKNGWLSPITARRVVVDGLDLSAVRTTAGDLNQGDLDLAMRAPEAVHGVAVPLVELSAGRQTLAFTVTVEHAHALAEAVNELAPGSAVALDGTSAADHRAAVLRRYHAGEIRILVNCALFTEGFDAPATSCIAIARPTKSRALYAQMVGRGTRLSDGKVDCRILDFAGIAGKHKLVGPADVLAGRELDDEERREAEALLGGGPPSDVLEVLGEAAERVRKKREAKPQPIPWTSTEIDIFGDGLDVTMREEWVGQPLTDELRDFLEYKGVDYAGFDRAKGDAMARALKERQQSNLCTYKQARILVRHGIKADRVTFTDASSLIDQLVKQNWRPTASWVVAAQRWVEERSAG